MGMGSQLAEVNAIHSDKSNDLLCHHALNKVQIQFPVGVFFLSCISKLHRIMVLFSSGEIFIQHLFLRT